MWVVYEQENSKEFKATINILVEKSCYNSSMDIEVLVYNIKTT